MQTSINTIEKELVVLPKSIRYIKSVPQKSEGRGLSIIINAEIPGASPVSDIP